MLRLCVVLVVACCVVDIHGQGILGYVSNSFSLLRPNRLETIQYRTARNASARDPDSYEERIYPAAKWACTARTVPAAEGMSTRSMFFDVFRYFSGDNEQRKDIDMSLPVSTKVKKLENSVYHETCLYIPEKFQQDPPKPSNPAVYVEEKPEFTVFTRRVSGYVISEAAWDEEVKALQKILEDKEPLADFSVHYRNNYDTPVRIFNRRTEVWFVKKAEGEVSAQESVAAAVEAIVQEADKPAEDEKKADMPAEDEKKVEEPAENRE